MIIKCKCCGGDIDISADKTFGTCEFCGSTMTLPKVDDDQRAAAFNRGNHFRRQGEFDKALAVYERIVAEDDNDAEAHWCCALCRFGIEYVEDPATYEWLPTCHRASFDSFLEDVDYLAAVEHSEGITKRQYQKDAAKIAEVQRGILATSQNEEPFDVFICYKESEDNGDRTRDSLLAQEIYYQLTEQGRRVFFARITLEDKAGTEYEPYIFAALNSARVMVAVGTTPEHFNAVWVKNEWSRFLALMRKDRKKLLLPCYRDMDPYDLPEQLSVLQSYDMGKIGFMQDLTRGISKVLDADKKPEATQTVKETVVVQQAAAGGTTTAAQVQRGNMALEDHEWDKADSFFEEALNLNPQCAEAYVGKLLARDKKPGFASWVEMQKSKYQAATTERLSACPEETAHIREVVKANVLDGYLDAKTIEQEYVFDRGYNSALSCRRSQKTKQLAELQADRLLSRAQQYASGDTKKQLEDGLAEITAVLDSRIAQAEKQDTNSIAGVKKAYAEHVAKADEEVRKLRADAEAKQESQYQRAVDLMDKSETVPDYEKAKTALKAMKGYKDSDELAEKCRQEIERLNEEKRQEEERQAAIRKKEAERAAKKRKKIIGIVAAAVVICAALAVLSVKVIIPTVKYNSAVSLMDSGDYEAAITAFEAMDGYKDSDDQITECRYLAAIALMDSEDYESAITAFEAMNGYKDSAEQIEVCQTAIPDRDYEAAVALMEKGDYEGAITAFEDLNGYKDSRELAENILLEHPEATPVGATLVFGAYEQDNNTSNGKEGIEWIVLEKENDQILVISKYALDCQKYNTINTSVTWESCSLRTWLNSTFINDAFSEKERDFIANATVTADANPDNSTDTGSDTQDQVFLLSITEAEKYFSSDNDRMCVPTAYAIAQGANISSTYSADDVATCWWWLRSSGRNSMRIADVFDDGSVSYNGISVNIGNVCVRPAMWIGLGE